MWKSCEGCVRAWDNMRIHEIQAAEGATETQETQLQLVDFELFVDAFELSKT